MKLKMIGLVALAVLTGCAGRYTGGGSLVNETGELQGRFALNNMAAADCFNGTEPGQDGDVDTARGSFIWNGSDGSAFACSITSGSAVLGLGSFSGTISRANSTFSASLPGATNCAVMVSPAYGSWAASVCAGYGGDCTTDFNFDSGYVGFIDGQYMASGRLDNGNIQYQKVNTQGICSSAATPQS